MTTFNSLFPTFLTLCANMHDLLLTVAFGLFVTGIVVTWFHRSTPRAWLHLLIRLLVLMSLLMMLPTWGNQVQVLLQNSILSGLGVDPTQVYQQYNQLLVTKTGSSPSPPWWSVLGQLQSALVNQIISGLLWLVGQFASLMLFWAYVFQKFILNLGYALSPLLIGLMAIPALKHIGSRYLLNLVGVLLWPLGWAVAALITQGILDFMTDQSFLSIDPSGSLYSLQNLLGLAATAFWIIFSTVAAPLVIQNVLAHGIQPGAALIAGGMNSFLQTAATTAGAAASASAAGIPAVTVGAAGLAAVMSTWSSAANMGNAGGIIVAGSGLPQRSAHGRPGEDITGDKAVRELISKSKPNSY